MSAHESWCDTRTGISTSCNCIASEYIDDIEEYIDQIESLRVKLDLAVEALEFECGNRCAHQNPCNAKDALAKIKGEK